ncbi:hypothetical protein [Sporosarcina sp. NPDC096371]
MQIVMVAATKLYLTAEPFLTQIEEATLRKLGIKVVMGAMTTRFFN